jgi:hypothetical protein
MNQSASIRFKKTKPVEKAVLISSQIEIEAMSGTEGFKALISLFVPKANPKEKMPRLAQKIQVGSDFVRPVTNSAEEMIDFHLKVAAFIQENAEKINLAIEKEQQAWVDMQNAYLAARTKPKDKKVIQLKTA